MAITPTAVRVDKSGGTGMEIDWPAHSAGAAHRSHYSFQYLRDACPCATCEEEREQSGRNYGEPPKPKAGALPMYRDPARPIEVAPVGRYAISFVWNDGHRAGIYSWEFLRTWCPCAECKAIRDSGMTVAVGEGGTPLKSSSPVTKPASGEN